MYDTRKLVEDLSKDKVLTKTTEYDIYSYYIGNRFQIGKAIRSPLREKDTHPSFGIYKSPTNGGLLFKDHGTGEGGDCIKFVQLLLNLKTYNDTLQKVWEDILDNGLTKTPKGLQITEEFSGNKKVLTIKRKNFTQTDYDYWGQYHLDREILDLYNVYPIERFWIDNLESNLYYSKESPMYAYKIFNSFKVYRPYSDTKKDKWRSNTSRYDIQGWEQLPESGDLLVITKSLKDLMVLRRFNVFSIAPQSEVSTLPKEVIYEAKKRFKRVVVLFDYDDAGIKGANALKEKYDLEITFVPKHYLELYSIKDVSDFVATFGIEATETLLKEIL